MKMLYFFPIIIFILLIVFFNIGLGKDPTLLPSTLINRPLPAFAVTTLGLDSRSITEKDFKGHITLLNVWASWCASCQLELPVLLDIASEKKQLNIVGLNYKDDQKSAAEFLAKMGNPYAFNMYDPQGKIGIKFGVYGTPETFIIDETGVVRYKYIGYLTREVWEQILLPIIQNLEIKNA